MTDLSIHGGQYVGLLCIGDPHLASRVPGFRRDDYPNTVLNKLRWSLDYANQNALLPVLLGDLFHRPRDNANSLVVAALHFYSPSTPNKSAESGIKVQDCS